MLQQLLINNCRNDTVLAEISYIILPQKRGSDSLQHHIQIAPLPININALPDNL